MPRRKLWVIPLVLLAGAIAWESLTARGTAAGDPPPAFTATAIDGRAVALTEYTGRSPVLINFFTNH